MGDFLCLVSKHLSLVYMYQKYFGVVHDNSYESCYEHSTLVSDLQRGKA